MVESRLLTIIFMQKKFFIIFFFGAGILVFPNVVLAQSITRSSSGCFEREGDDNTAEVWMQSMDCTITVTNQTQSTVSTSLDVRNVDPNAMIVKDSSNNEMSVTRNTSSLTIPLSLAPFAVTSVHITPWETVDNDFWFAAITDPQPEPGGESPNPIFVSIMDQLKTIHVPFTLIGGDLIAGSSSDADAHNDEYELLDEVLADYSGTVFPVAGNHDAKQDVASHYEKYFGSDDYTFTYGDTRFIAFNSANKGQVDSTLSEESIAWLTNTLANATEKHRIVYMHHPLLPPSWATIQGIIAQEQRQQLAELFVQYGVELLIVGHAHGYEYRYISSTDFPGLSGGFYQLDAAGSGGSFNAYSGDHFFILVHVSPNGIDHYKIDYSSFNLAVTPASNNDGTESSVAFTITNLSPGTIPHLRVQGNVLASETLYGVTNDNTFFPVTTENVGGVQRGVVLLSDIPSGTSFSLKIGEQRNVVQGIENIVSSTGVIRFDTLPTSAHVATELGVQSTAAEARITITDWDASRHLRAWTESSEDGNEIVYTLFGLQPGREYRLYESGKFQLRFRADNTGTGTFRFAEASAHREYMVRPGALLPSSFGVMPASGGGANLQLLSGDGSVQKSFFAYDKKLSGGFDSLWLDSDGDGTLELATAPFAGNRTQVRVFAADGTLIDSFDPFGHNTTAGVEMIAADIDGDVNDELLIASNRGKKSIVRVYDFDSANNVFKLRDSFRAYGAKYTGDVMLASSDINDDGRTEILITPKRERAELQVFQWKPAKGIMKLWQTHLLPSSSATSPGFTVTGGDVNNDGKDDIVVGTLSGRGFVQIFGYDAASSQLSLLHTRNVFGKNYDGALQLHVANIDTGSRPEILVAPMDTNADDVATSTQPASRVLVLTSAARRSTRSLVRVTRLKVFGKNYRHGLTVALADTNSDGQKEIAVTPTRGSGEVRCLTLVGGALRIVTKKNPYDVDFSGGLQLTH